MIFEPPELNRMSICRLFILGKSTDGCLLSFATKHLRRLEMQMTPAWFSELVLWNFSSINLKLMSSHEKTNNQRAVLQHYDKIAGTFFINDMAQKRNLISNMIGHGGKTFTEILAKYNLCIDNSPTKLRAKVLIPPKINFRESKEATNGSFDLRNVTFAK